mgnify:CR=1 FL=1
MSVKWKVIDMNRDITQDGKSDVVTTIHYTASDIDTNNNIGSSIGSVDVKLGSQSFIAFKDITQEIATQWAKDALGADEVKNIEDSIALQINALANPTTASGVPF